VYRLHFQQEAFITLERDVTIRVGQPFRVDVMLTTAPKIVKEAPAPASPPPPPPLPPPAPVETPRRREPITVSIPTFLDRNFIGREATKESVLECADATSVRLLQLRDPLREHVHASADEALYVVAGEGTVRINGREEQVASGVLSIIPRGNAHELTRRGRNPVIVLSILSGASCEGAAGESPTAR
jgi:mannose-6-phosphate isomerase-like protein (cupin superfamily)